jgi:hypothetical protein
MRKKSDSVSLSYCWHEKKSLSMLISSLKPYKLTRNFSLSSAHDVMDLGGSLAYQLAAPLSRDIMNDLARVVVSPLDEAIAVS